MILEYTNKIQDIGITLGVFLLHFLFFLFFPMVLRIPGVSLLTDNTLCMNFATLMIKLFSIDNKNSNLFLSFKVSKRGIFSLTFWNKIFLSHSNVLHWMTACISSPTVSSPFSLQKLQNRSDLSSLSPFSFLAHLPVSFFLFWSLTKKSSTYINE